MILGAPAPLPFPSAPDTVEDEEEAKDAEMAGSPDATRVTPGPAAVVVLAAFNALVVSVAESIAGAELD